MTAISRFCRFILVVALWIGGALLSIAPLQAAITAQDLNPFLLMRWLNRLRFPKH